MSTNTARMLQQLRRQRLPPMPTIRDLLKMYELTAMKSLSQNFLLDHKLTSKIAAAAGDISNCVVVEVGPGPGGITRSILERQPQKVILIEKDKRFKSLLGILKDVCPGQVEVHWGDVLSFEMSRILPQELRMEWNDRCPKIHIIGNLPFNISTPLISHWLEAISAKKNAWAMGRVPLTLTFQKEVAERLNAPVFNEQRSRLSVMTEYLTHVKYKFEIKGSAFVPKPDVDAGVVKFVPRKEPLIKQPYKLVEKVVRHAFCMRNKYCCRPISSLFPSMVRFEFTKRLFGNAMVFSNSRPFELTVEDFQRLCDAYADIIAEYPELNEYNYRGRNPDEKWANIYGSKFESFTGENLRASSVKPLDVISDHLAGDCQQEIEAEERDIEELADMRQN